MTFKLKHIAVAIAVLSMGAAHATVQTIAIGSTTNTTIADPSGSGRVTSIQALYGASTLTFNNIGVDYAAYDANNIAGAVGALNTGDVKLTGSTGLNEQWKSYAQSGPGFEAVFFPTKAAADADPQNASYYENGDISSTSTGSFRISSAVKAPVASLSVKTSNSVGDTIAPVGGIQTINSTGQTILSGNTKAVMTGGTVVIEDMSFDIFNGNVTAKVSGTKSATGSGSFAKPAVVFAPQVITLWTFSGVYEGGADISGPTGIDPTVLLSPNSLDLLTNPSLCGTQCFNLLTDNSTGSPRYAFQAKTRISNLTMTTAGLNFLSSALGTTAVGQAAFSGANNYAGKWGSVETNLVFYPGGNLEDPPFVLPSNIPEPSTYALMGLGLAGISWATRRRQAKI